MIIYNHCNEFAMALIMITSILIIVSSNKHTFKGVSHVQINRIRNRGTGGLWGSGQYVWGIPYGRIISLSAPMLGTGRSHGKIIPKESIMKYIKEFAIVLLVTALTFAVFAGYAVMVQGI